MNLFSRRARVTALVASTAVLAALAGTGGSAQAAPSGGQDHGTPGVEVSRHDLVKQAGRQKVRPRSSLPAGVPSSGRYAFLLALDTSGTAHAYAGAAGGGKAAAHAAAQGQKSRITAAQNGVIDDLPSGSKVLYRTHAVLAGLAITTNVENYPRLTHLAGVRAVYPIAPKSPTNSYAVPLQGAPAAWQAHGDLGAHSTVAIIDTGIDYTHADFGGAGTRAAYDSAKAALGASPDFPSAKVVGGYDLAGDDYNADPTSDSYNPVASPDPYPLDCNSHGTHVAGTVAGYGENADGSTYTGAYDQSTPFDSMKIGPGMAPQAKLYGYRVFGCEGSTDLVGAAIDKASDPNGDGDPSDHVDVINMSLGSDFGSPQDGDSVATEAATQLGILVVIASGNAGDLYDVGGSPGNAPSALTAAASVDAYAQVDGLVVAAPASIAGTYPAERSIAYDWDTGDDLSGDVVRVTQPGNLDACQPLNETDAAAVAGHVAFVEWTDVDADRRCGSAARAANLVTAGASGFIYADDEENFSAGITGSAAIPGVLVAKSGGDEIRTELQAGHTVTIDSTAKNGKATIEESRNDLLASFSSRGIGDAGNVKPDITAVGDSVFSAGSGTGDDGLNDSGTSMATPMTAGAAALVRSVHPDWTPLQAKADLMNTAGQDLYTKVDHTGDTYAPQRVGAGRLEVDGALDNEVVAYDADDPGSVSASFGPQAVTAPTTLHKSITVRNLGLTERSFEVSYVSRTSVPGATYSVSPSSVSLDPKSARTLTLTLTLDPAQMTKTVDPTIATDQSGVPRQFQADASGFVQLTATSGGPDLRVPAYAAPRPASQMTQPSSLTLPDGEVQTALLPLTGQQVNTGSGATRVLSTVAGFELQATSGPAPQCTAQVTSGCVGFPDERAADLKRVGTTSSAPQYDANGEDPLEGYAYFAINTQGRWRTAASSQEFDIYVDSDDDGTADTVTFNTRLPSTDVLVTETIDLASADLVDVEPLNDSFGDTDTALFDSDTMVMPVAIAALPGIAAGSSRIHYAVLAFSPYQSAPVDQVGDVDGENNLLDPLTFDVLNPGVALYGSYTGDASPLLYPDSPSAVLALRRDATAYQADDGEGAMIVHFHNTLGHKTQVLALRTAPGVTLSLAPNPAQRGQQVTATVTVPGSGTPATGAVRLEVGSTVVASGAVANGTSTLHFTLGTAGTYAVHAEYAGDDGHEAATSAPVRLVVAKTRPSITLAASPHKVRYRHRVRATVRIATVAGFAPRGSVTLRLPHGKVLGRGVLNRGVATIVFTVRTRHAFVIHAAYAGDSNYLAGQSRRIRIKVRR